MTLGSGSVDFLLALADDEHLMGQRHTEWIGVTPFLEEDLAFASIGQDELGHAALLYEFIAGPDADLDDLALRREPGEYRSCWLAEAECSEWSDALVRHWLYDAAEPLRWGLLSAEDQRVADIVARVEREESFHLRHADALIDALSGSDDARARLESSLADLLPRALGLFEPPAGEIDAIDDGLITSSMVTLVPEWQQRVDARFGPQDWSSIVAPDQSGRTVRSPEFGPMYDAMREVMLIDPAARW